MRNLRFVVFIYLFLLSSSLFAKREDIFIKREDGTMIQGYLDSPNNVESFPVVVFIDGSHNASVMVNHEKLSDRFIPHNIGLISLEKRGITQKKVTKKEFIVHDCFEERFQDYTLLLKHLEQKKITGYNGSCILLGGSEGGKIAPKLTLGFSSSVKGIVLVGSGGGLSFAEEMKYQSQELIKKGHSLKELGFKGKKAKDPMMYEKWYNEMLQSPDSLKMYLQKTWKWWASYLRYDLLSDLLKLELPVYMVHGKEDVIIPVKSADLVKEAFDKAEKTNLHYARYENLGHALTGRDDVYEPMVEWVCDRVKSNQGL